MELIEERQTVKAELEALIHGSVPVVLRESAELLKIPVSKGVLALQQATLDYLMRVQDQVSGRLHSRL